MSLTGHNIGIKKYSSGGIQDTILDIVIKKYSSGGQVPVYEALDYIITPEQSEINTNVLVDGTTVVELTAQLNQRTYQGARFFSSNDTDTDDPGWGEPGTWGLQFEDAGYTLSIKVLGVSQDVTRTNIVYSDLSSRKLRYNLTASGYLNIYDTSDVLYKSYDVSAQTNLSQTSSTPIKLFHRYATWEYITLNSYIYDSKIWKNNTLIRHYIPVKRLSDNVVGLYDEVNETFHPNEISGYNFTGVSKSTPEYIYEAGGEQVYTITPMKAVEEASRYIPAQYCQNDNKYLSSQSAHATFSIPWAPSPTISHKIVTEFIPISMPGNSYGWAVFFGGNVSNLQHMANVFGGCANINGNCWFGAYDPNVQFSNFTQYYNKLWRVEIESQAGTSNSHSYNVKIDVDGTNIINSPSSSTNSITGTFDPYFIFGGQILRDDGMFRQIYMKMYSFDIYDDNVLVYSLRPYYDTVDQLYGMYDLVNDRFYSSMYSAHPFTGEL